MISLIWSLIIGKFGLGLVTAGCLLAAWWLIPNVPWLTDRLRQGLLFAGLAVGIWTLSYGHGFIDGRAAYKEKIERQIKNAVSEGTEARERSLRELDAGRVPDAWFRDD